MPANATTTSRGRFYTWGRGERYWSVTTILKAYPKDALKWWAARVVAEFAVDRSKTWFTMKREEAIDWLRREPLRFTNDRADVGSAVHAAAESWVLQQPMKGDFSEEERQAIGHFIGWVQTFGVRFLETEASVYNRTQKYAGTLDAIVEIPYQVLLDHVHGNPAKVPWTPREGRDVVTLLVDYKTGGDVDEGKGVYPEVAFQLTAYAHAEFVGAPNGSEVPLPELDGAAVLQVQAKGWRFVPVDALRPDVWKAFLYLREVFRFRENIAPEVLGEALVPPPAEIPVENRAGQGEGDPAPPPAEAPPAAPTGGRRRRPAS